METGSKCAASMTISVVAAADLGVGAAHDAGQPDRPGVVGDDQVLGVQHPLGAVERGQLLAGLRAAHPDRPVSRVRS